MLCYYHQHCIAAEYTNRWVLDTCGYHTYTTKERLQRYVPFFRIHSVKGTWWGYDYDGVLFELVDGIVIPKKGYKEVV